MARIAGAILVVQAGSMEISSPSNSRHFGCRAGGRYAGKWVSVIILFLDVVNGITSPQHGIRSDHKIQMHYTHWQKLGTVSSARMEYAKYQCRDHAY